MDASLSSCPFLAAISSASTSYEVTPMPIYYLDSRLLLIVSIWFWIWNELTVFWDSDDSVAAATAPRPSDGAWMGDYFSLLTF